MTLKKSISAILEKLIADVTNVTLQELFENIINECRYTAVHNEKR